MASRWFTQHLVHVCDIERDAGTARTSSGAIGTSWSTVGTSQPCRYVERTQRLADEARGLITYHERLVLVGGTADVQENDRLRNILDGDGGTVAVGPFTVIQKLVRRDINGDVHHISLSVERVDVS